MGKGKKKDKHPKSKKKSGKRVIDEVAYQQVKKAEKTEEKQVPYTVDKDKFTYGKCPICGWKGKARRSRDKARRDAADHFVAEHP